LLTLKTKAGLRSGTLALLFGILVITTFFVWIGVGSEYYGIEQDVESDETYAAINQTLKNIEDNGKAVEDKVRSIKENKLGTIFFIPAVIIDALILPLELAKDMITIITSFTKSIGIPDYILAAFISSILIYVAYLIIDAYLRFSNT
jgi:hypothetical protein